MASRSLHWKTPMQVLTGETSDISILLHFQFYEAVFYTRVHTAFPSTSTEESGYFVGFGESVGDSMTLKVLTADTQKIIDRSNVRTALDPKKPNLRLSTDGEPDTFIKSKSDTIESKLPSLKPLPTFHPKELIGRSFLSVPTEDGQTLRLRIIKAISDHQSDLDQHPDRVKFLVSNKSGTLEEIRTYNDILEYLSKDDEHKEDVENQYLQFKDIIGHQGPLTPQDSNYKGSKYNVLVDWSDGEVTYEPLHIIAADDPISCATYAKKNGLINMPGWKRFRRFVEHETMIETIVNKVKLQTYKPTIKFKYGFIVPNTHHEAVMLDKENNNTAWQEASDLEIKLLMDYNVFKDLGKGNMPPEEYVKIKCRMIYDVKHDGRHRGRLVAGGHLTPVPFDSPYSGVVSLRGLRIIIFLAELNSLTLWGADVRSAYLEVTTQEKVYFIAGSEFGTKAGHTLVVHKALYGLRSSGARWHKHFADILHDLGFTQCKMEPDIWMRKQSDHYEYFAVNVDDLAIASKDPNKIVQDLQNQHDLKLKGTGPLKFHLGCDFARDPDNTLAMGPRKYIDKILTNYEHIFKEKPKEASSPLEKNDHPELDTSELLDDSGIKIYQSMIGAIQWALSLGRFDVHTAVMTMSQFRLAPRKGHLHRLQRIYGYLKRYKHGEIRIRTEIPTFGDIQDIEYDWKKSVYGDIMEEIPSDIPEPLGKSVVQHSAVDANLQHCLLTGRAVTGVMHFLNSTLADWYCKKQATVETATYGSEFVAARIAADQIIDLRLTLRYLGVPLEGKSLLFGDNNSVIISSTLPHSSLKKRHNALSYHRIRECIAAKIFGFYKISGKLNPADIVSKHNGFQTAYPLLKPLLFWRGDINGVFKNEYDIEGKIRPNGECEETEKR
jgi:Reverse transcriptase (RNA-dependent DNA polymerase)